MGNGNSKASQPPPIGQGNSKPGIFNRAKKLLSGNQSQQSQFQQPGTVIPQQPSEFSYLEFILNSPPLKVVKPLEQQPVQTNQNKNKKILDSLKNAIIQYNLTWNFGNQENGEPQSLLQEQTYKSFKSFVQNLLTNQSAQNNAPQGMNNNNKKSFEAKKEIVKKIHGLLQGNYSLVNKTFDMKISDIFPSIELGEFVEVNLLDLASIIGAEHIVIYLLMCGADPSLSNTKNKDSATLMLEYQILLYKSQPQQQPQAFIILPRILYVLFLLGSVDQGVDLSAIFETKEQKNKENLSGLKRGVKVSSSILNMLAQMPGIQSGISAENQTLQNGGSIPLLLEILERNNPVEIPKFFKVIDSLETPYALNVLYNVLLNKNIDDQKKIELVRLLVLKCGADITNVPTFTSNLVKKSGNTPNISINTFKKIEFLVSVSVRDLQNIKPILEIFSQRNPEFERKLKDQYGNDLKGLNSISNKNSTKTLMQIIDLLRQKNAIMAAEFDKFLENYYQLRAKESVAKAQIYGLVEQSPNLTGLPQSNFKVNLTQMASSVLPGQQQMQTVPMGSLNPAPKQKKKGFMNRFFGKNNKQKITSNMSSIGATAPIGNQQYSPQKSKSLFNTFKDYLSKNAAPPTSIASNSSQSTSTPLSSPLISSQSNPQTVAGINSSKNPAAPLTSTTSFSSLSQSATLIDDPSQFAPLTVNSQSLPVGQSLIGSQPNLLLNLQQPPSITSTGNSQNRPIGSLAPLSSQLISTNSKSNLSQPLLSSASNSTKGSSAPLISSLNTSLGLTASNKKNKTNEQTALQTNPPISPTSTPQEPKKTLREKAKRFFGIGKNNSPPLLEGTVRSNIYVPSKNMHGGQSGGKKIQMRTYHFLKSKKYSERAFIAERPIIAADNAYDFMKLHYDIGSKKVTFTIHDRVNNKKYKYTARTLKDGTNVIKSAK